MRSADDDLGGVAGAIRSTFVLGVNHQAGQGEWKKGGRCEGRIGNYGSKNRHLGDKVTKYRYGTFSHTHGCVGRRSNEDGSVRGIAIESVRVSGVDLSD